MEIVYTSTAQYDIIRWKKSGNKILQAKITRLVTQIQNSPYKGIGKPHPLKGNLSGCFGVKINDQHRIVYEVSNNTIIIHSLWGHYFDK